LQIKIVTMKNLIYTLQHKKVLGFLPLLHLIGIVAGGLGGYAYFYFIGCRTGTCSITSNPWLSVVWGMAVGYLLFDLFYKGSKKESPEKNT